MSEEKKWLARAYVIGIASVLLGVVGLLARSSAETFKSNVELFSLVVATITLVVVAYQVFIAREELDAVSEDVARNRVLFEKASRVAILRLTYERKTLSDTPHFQDEQDGTRFYGGPLTFAVYNLGSRTVGEFMVTIGIPEPYQMNDPQWAFNDDLSTSQDDGEPSYSFFTRLFTESTIFPNTNLELAINLRLDEGDEILHIPFFYRVVHEDGATPSKPDVFSVLGSGTKLDEHVFKVVYDGPSFTLPNPTGSHTENANRISE